MSECGAILRKEAMLCRFACTMDCYDNDDDKVIFRDLSVVLLLLLYIYRGIKRHAIVEFSQLVRYPHTYLFAHGYPSIYICIPVHPPIHPSIHSPLGIYLPVK